MYHFDEEGSDEEDWIISKDHISNVEETNFFDHIVEEIRQNKRKLSDAFINYKFLMNSTQKRIFFEALKKNTSLTELFLPDKCLTEEELKVMFKNLENNKNITKFSFSDNELQNEGFKIIGDFFKNFKGNVLQLDLSDNKSQDSGVVELIDGLKEYKKLISLNVSENCFQFQGMKSISDCLSVEYSNLRSLHLFGNSFGIDEMKVLGEGIKKTKNLIYLDISNCSIHDSPIIEFSKGMKFNNSLKYLYLEDNNVSDAGFEQFFMDIRDNEKLVELRLSNNKISNKICSSIADFLENNKSLEVLDLSEHEFSSFGIIHFINVLISKNIWINELLIDSRMYQNIVDNLIEENVQYKLKFLHFRNFKYTKRDIFFRFP
eukprot:gene3857-7017_t